MPKSSFILFQRCFHLHLNRLQLLHIMRSFQWSRLNNPDLCLHSGNVARRLRRLREGWNLSATNFPTDMKLESIWTQFSWQSHTINQVNQVQKIGKHMRTPNLALLAENSVVQNSFVKRSPSSSVAIYIQYQTESPANHCTISYFEANSRHIKLCRSSLWLLHRSNETTHLAALKVLPFDLNRSASGCTEEAVGSFKFLCSQANACNSWTWCEFYKRKAYWLKWS